LLTEDEELVTNSLETIVNLAHLMDLRIFSSLKQSYINIKWEVVSPCILSYTIHNLFQIPMWIIHYSCAYSEKKAVQAVVGILDSSVKAWNCAAAELLGRLIINPDNEPFISPLIPQVC